MRKSQGAESGKEIHTPGEFLELCWYSPGGVSCTPAARAPTASHSSSSSQGRESRAEINFKARL